MLSMYRALDARPSSSGSSGIGTTVPLDDRTLYIAAMLWVLHVTRGKNLAWRTYRDIRPGRVELTAAEE